MSTLRVDVLDGLARRSVEVTADSVRFGRDPICEVVLAGDGRVSRTHAELRRLGERWLLVDHASRNGTYHNGRRVVDPEPVEPGDRIAIGNYVVVISAVDAPLADTTDATEDDRTRLRVETGLSARELEILQHVCAGLSDARIAQELFISVKTVQTHLDRIRDKSDCRRRAELIRFAHDHGVA